jgi:L-ribulose-5-phosphate 3-epimerase
MADSHLSRRTFLGRTAAAFSLGYSLRAAQSSALRIGVTDWNLHRGAEPGVGSKAAALGFEGVQVSFGRNPVDGKMPVDHPAIIAQYLEVSKQTGISIDGTCVDRLHDNGLKNDPLGLKWVSGVGLHSRNSRAKHKSASPAVLRTRGSQD